MHRRDFFRHLGTTAGTAATLGSALGAERSEAESESRFEKQGQRLKCDLSGAWRFYLDETNTGVSRRWFEKEPSNAEAKLIQVTVPSVWQQYLDIQGGVGWYFRDVSLPPETQGRNLRLRFGAADYFTRVWWNGQEVGSHEGGFTPFEVNVSHAARPGENRVAVRVLDVGPDMEIDGFRYDEISAGHLHDWREGFNFNGIWQPIGLIVSDPVYVADVFLVPNLASSSAEARLEVLNSLDRKVEASLAVTVRPWRGNEATAGDSRQNVTLAPGLNRVTLPINIRQAHAWSVADPFLYLAETSVSEGARRLDDTTVRFGLRELTVRPDGFFYLNGKRIFLKSAHYQTTEPLTLAFPFNDQMARTLIATAKELGSNFMRHQDAAVASSILDAADELGIMIQAEPAMARHKDFPALGALAVRETTELIRRDRNRPSMGIWCMVNEQAAGMSVVRKMCQVARDLDPSRLITESAGGNSRYYPPHSSEGISYLDEHYYPGNPLSEGMLGYLRTRGVPGQLYFVTETGYAGLEDFDAVLAKYGSAPNKTMLDYRGFARQKKGIEEFFQTTELKSIFPDLAAFREAAQTMQANAVRRTFEGFRANPNFSGYNVVQLFDSNANEVDGLIDFWINKRKKAFYAMQEINRPLLLVVQCTPFLNPKVGREVEVAVTLVNDEQIAGRKTLRVRVLGPTGAELFSREESVEARPWANRLFTQKVDVGQQSGQVTVKAELLDGSQVLLTKEEYLTVYNPRDLRWPDRGFAVFDPEQKWPEQKRKDWQSRTNLRVREFDPDTARPEVVVVTEFAELWRRPPEFQKLLRLVDSARRGSTILFMGVPRDGTPPQGSLMSEDSAFYPLTIASVLGFRLGVSGGWGTLTNPYSWGASAIEAGCGVTNHPIFEGLPGPGLMDWEYGNVVTKVVATPMRLTVENTGPSVKIIPYENGKVVFCTLKLLENLEQDGLAEKLFCNMVAHLDRGLPGDLRSPTPREQEFARFQQTQLRDCWEKYLRA